MFQLLKSICIWRNEYYQCHGDFALASILVHMSLTTKIVGRKHCLGFMTMHIKRISQTSFSVWVNTELLPNSILPPGFPRSITPRTTRRWLHDLGFSPTPYKKGLYFDGHEREDVVEYWHLYLRKLEVFQLTHLPPPICSGGSTEEVIGSSTAEKRLVVIYHDESSFHSNEGQH